MLSLLLRQYLYFGARKASKLSCKAGNSGIASAPWITMYKKTEVEKHVKVEMTWTPCACDVGTRTICAYPVETLRALPREPVCGAGRCTMLHVLPALPPDFANTTLAPGTQFTGFTGTNEQMLMHIQAPRCSWQRPESSTISHRNDKRH